MKYLYYLLFFNSLIPFSCNSNDNNQEGNNLGDTIQTASGLQYYYLKKGKGRKIEKGCEVGTYLSLMVNDSVVWKSNEGPG